MKAVIYARYSSDSQREESIEGQLRECTEFAEKQGFTLLVSYIDRALSAKTANRPEFQRMIKDSKKGLFDLVIVWKLDRFARNRNDSAHYRMLLKKNNVKVISATERIAEDSSGILMLSFLEGYAEYYSAELAEKVVRGMKENALKCKWNGGTIPLGFHIDAEQRMQINPLVAPIVREAFQRYADGSTVKSIVEWLYTKDVKNSRGNPVRIDMVQNMLKNRRYVGEYRFQDIVVPDGIPQMIPEDLFNRVQERMKKNKKAPARYKAEDRYLLTTKLFCGECGAFMAGECGTSRNGKTHHYYKCGSVKRRLNGCKKKNVRKDDIEHAVISLTMKMLNDGTYIQAIIDKLMAQQKRENTLLPHLKNQLSQTKKGIENILNAIQQGIFTASTKERLEELEQAKEKLEIQIAQEEMGKPLLTPEKILFWLEQFKRMDVGILENREKLIDTFVNSIFLYDDETAEYFV